MITFKYLWEHTDEAHAVSLEQLKDHLQSCILWPLPALSHSYVDDFLSLPPRILHRLIGPALISFNAADHQIGTVYHFAVPCLDSRLEISVCGGLAYFDLVIVILKRIAFVVIRN